MLARVQPRGTDGSGRRPAPRALPIHSICDNPITFGLDEGRLPPCAVSAEATGGAA
jgi:hypothetical protein